MKKTTSKIIIDKLYETEETPSILTYKGNKYPVRKFDVVAIQLKIVYNRFGEHDPEGKMYILRENLPFVHQEEDDCLLPNPFVTPLVIRANKAV